MEAFARKKLELEYKRVEMSRYEMEFKVDEKLVEIEKLKENIKLQDKRLKELAEQLGE